MLPRPPYRLFLLFSVGCVASVLIAAPRRAPKPAGPALVRIVSAPPIDLTRCDGGLPPVAGAENFGVFRASRARPEIADGKGYTYNHHPDLAVWHGRFYVAWDSGEKDEDTWPARELYSTSADGRAWSTPAELFPQGVSTPTRLYFFHAANGRMLAFAGLRIDHAKTEEDTKGPMVVREIRPDHTLGPVRTLRPPPGGARPTDPAMFSSEADRGFTDACEELLHARLALETQDNGVFLEPAERIPWHNPNAWPGGRIASGFWKAPSFYARADGAIVGIGKNGWTTISRDGGKTWDQPSVPPSLITNNAKVWGQRTGDGRYALVYNPTPRPRYPLAIVTGDDGITFGAMRAVQPRFPPQRYPGLNKNTGLQYVRGLSLWADDGSISDTRHALWLVYSANKEDLWVSRIPVPITEAADPRWNIYQPNWARVTASDPTAVELESWEPFDCTEATRLFARRTTVSVACTVLAPAVGAGAVDIELVGGTTAARPVRLRLAGDGVLRALDGIKMVELGRFPPGSAVNLRVTANSKRHMWSVTVNQGTSTQGHFVEAADALDRLTFRVWARADADRAPEFLPATAAVGREYDVPAPIVTTRVAAVSID